jgi:KaiC/GvpD/RAD55 family RecA-like ATPase
MESKPNFDLIDNPKPERRNRLFERKTMNDWIDGAKTKPIPRRLFGDFWWEGEVCILFADQGTGKSILAVQIADTISSGRATDEVIRCDAEKQRVLYFDFELTDKQQENRCSRNYQDHYIFSELFERLEIEWVENCPDDAGYYEYIREQILVEVEETGARVVIIDNITWITGGTENAKDALPLMKWFKSFSKSRGVSFLVIAHTPKIKPHPLTANDIQGSKMLSNFCDSIIAMGKSTQGSDIRYLKVCKGRMDKYDSNNVVVCRMCKPDNMVRFVVEGCGRESEHLPRYTDDDRDEMIQRVKEMSVAGMSQRSIADEVGLSVGTINNYLKK